MLADNAADDPRYRAVLGDRRDNDPSRRMRRYASELLLPGWEHGDGYDGPPGLGAIEWALQPTGQPADKWFARLNQENDASRHDALRMLTEEAAEDPRRLPVLLDRLAHDPSPGIRQYQQACLLPSPPTRPHARALQETPPPRTRNSGSGGPPNTPSDSQRPRTHDDRPIEVWPRHLSVSLAEVPEGASRWRRSVTNSQVRGCAATLRYAFQAAGIPSGRRS